MGRIKGIIILGAGGEMKIKGTQKNFEKRLINRIVLWEGIIL